MSFTYSTIIGRDPRLIEGHLWNVTKYAGFDKLECEKKLLVIVYLNNRIPTETTQECLEVCRKYGADIKLYLEPTDVFIDNLYACWNLGYQYALDGLVFRGGSDQVFSKNSFLRLVELAENLEDPKTILQANTIENAGVAMRSRHIRREFGEKFETFPYDEFEFTVDELAAETDQELVTIDEALRAWGHPTPLRTAHGVIDRVDGCSWLMTRKDWKSMGRCLRKRTE